MSESYVGEIRCFAFGKTPKGWVECNGQLLQVRENQALFSLLGIRFGGDGKTTFGVPDLRGRAPRMPQNYVQGTAGGRENITLTADNLPLHRHNGRVSSDTATIGGMAGTIPAAGASPTNNFYAQTANNQVSLEEDTVLDAGSGAPLNNMQPYLAVRFCIATTGFYPPRS